MWLFNETSQPHPPARGHVVGSESRIDETSSEELHDRSRFQESIERNARVNALREELHTMALQNASNLPSAIIAPDTALPRSTNSSRIGLALHASTLADVTNVAGTYATVLGSESQTSMAVRGVSDARRFGIYLPSATASENNLLLHRLAASTLHILQERAASLPRASSAGAAALEQRPSRPRRPEHGFEHPINDDPPPEYVAFDPHPFFDTEPRPRRRSAIDMIETLCKDGLKATTGKVGKSVVKHVEDVCKIAKDVPTAFKEAQVKLSSKRAKDKIRWLEKRNYLSGQERLLTQELVR